MCRRLLLVLILAALTGCGLLRPAPTGHIHGHVQLSSCAVTGVCWWPHAGVVGVNGIKVRLTGSVIDSVVTSGLGSFEFSAFPVGEYTVAIDSFPSPSWPRIFFAEPSQSVQVISGVVGHVMFTGEIR